MIRLSSTTKVMAAFAVGVGVTLAAQSSILPARAAQPYMDAALEQLRAARASLQQAEPNKGGHREAAIGLVDQAITQVREGIAFAAR